MFVGAASKYPLSRNFANPLMSDTWVRERFIGRAHVEGGSCNLSGKILLGSKPTRTALFDMAPDYRPVSKYETQLLGKESECLSSKVLFLGCSLMYQSGVKSSMYTTPSFGSVQCKGVFGFEGRRQYCCYHSMWNPAHYFYAAMLEIDTGSGAIQCLYTFFMPK